MSRETGWIVWGLALVIAAFTLGMKDTDPIPWAVGLAGIWAALAGLLVVANSGGLTSSPTKPGAKKSSQ